MVGCFLPAAELRSAYQETGKDPVSGCRQATGWQGLCWRQHESCDEQGGNTENWRGHTAELTWQLEGTHSYLLTGLGSLWWTLPLDRHTTKHHITASHRGGQSKQVSQSILLCSVSTSETEAGLSNQVEYWEAANRPQALISFHWPWCYKVIQFPLAFSICNVTKLLSSHWPSVALMLQSYLKSIEDLYQSFYLLSSKSESIILFWYIKHRNQ